MSDPEKSVLEGLHEIVPNGVTLRRMFLLLTRLHYSSADNFGAMAEKLKEYVWTPGLTTKLKIDLDFNYIRGKKDTVPCIYVGTDDIGYNRKVVDNQKSTNEDRSGENYVKGSATNIILRHAASSPDDAWIMADLTAQFYLGIRKMLIDKTGFESFEVVAQKGTKIFMRTAEESDQQFEVDLLMSLTFNSIWLTTLESHRIKTWGFAKSLAAVT